MDLSLGMINVMEEAHFLIGCFMSKESFCSKFLRLSFRIDSHRQLGAFDVKILDMGLSLLKYSILFSFHRVLHERYSMKGNKVVT